jgi:hypothetical protein
MSAVLPEAEASGQQRHHDRAVANAGETGERSAERSSDRGLEALRSRQLDPRHPFAGDDTTMVEEWAGDRSGDRNEAT